MKEMSEEQSGHFYKRNGKACHQVPKKDGKGMRGINLAWDRPLGLVPSVTTVLSIMNKHQLNVWKENQMLLAALTLGRIEGESDEDFCKRVRTDAFTQVVEAADIGTLVHDAIEKHFENEDYDEKWEPYVRGVIIELNEMYPDIRDWVAEKRFAHESGYGGCIDLHSPSTGIIVDFKGKDGDFEDKKKLAYDQYIQLSAYQMGLEMPVEECANIFFSRTHPGVATGHKWDKKKIRQGREIFNAALQLWKAVKGYDSSFQKGTSIADTQEV